MTCRCGNRLDVPDEPGSYRCPECDRRVTVSAAPVREMAAMPVSGVIPWGALSLEVKRVLHEGRERLASGRGPGAALSGVTKRLGVKPCQGCWRRAQALNQLGWPVVTGYTVVVLAAGAALTRWVF